MPGGEADEDDEDETDEEEDEGGEKEEEEAEEEEEEEEECVFEDEDEEEEDVCRVLEEEEKGAVPLESEGEGLGRPRDHIPSRHIQSDGKYKMGAAASGGSCGERHLVCSPTSNMSQWLCPLYNM